MVRCVAGHCGESEGPNRADRQFDRSSHSYTEEVASCWVWPRTK